MTPILFLDYLEGVSHLKLEYFGHFPEKVIQLDMIAEAISLFYDFSADLFVNPEYHHLCHKIPTEGKKYFHTIRFKDGNESVLNFIKDSKLTFPKIQIADCRECLIYPNAVYDPMLKHMIDKYLRFGRLGEPNEELCGKWIVGADNEQVFNAARHGIKTTIITPCPEIYKILFPHGLIDG